MSLHFEQVDLMLAGKPVLHGVDLSLRQGEQVALIGPSGAGKTSLLMLANTHYRPSRGQLALLGQAPWGLPARSLRGLRARVGCVYQAPPFPARQRVINAVRAGRLGRMSALEALWLLLSPHDAASIHTQLDKVDLADKLWERCEALSGGQRQRVGLARVLYQRPELILADEPVASLDPRLAETTVSLLCREARTLNATLLMSLHSVELALAHFPRLIGLRNGRIMFDRPREAVNQALLDQLYAGDSTSEAGSKDSSQAAFRKGMRC